MRRVRANLIQLHGHGGPYFNHWKERLIAALDAAPIPQGDATDDA